MPVCNGVPIIPVKEASKLIADNTQKETASFGSEGNGENSERIKLFILKHFINTCQEKNGPRTENSAATTKQSEFPW